VLLYIYSNKFLNQIKITIIVEVSTLDTKILIYIFVCFVIVKYWTKYKIWYLIKDYIFSLDLKILSYILIFSLITFLFILSNQGGKFIAAKFSKRKS
jgi:hypothetical protein